MVSTPISLRHPAFVQIDEGFSQDRQTLDGNSRASQPGGAPASLSTIKAG
jgi:hypothetical protein